MEIQISHQVTMRLYQGLLGYVKHREGNSHTFCHLGKFSNRLNHSKQIKRNILPESKIITILIQQTKIRNQTQQADSQSIPPQHIVRKN